MNKIQHRLSLVRKFLKKESVDGFYLTERNFFGLEFPPASLAYLEWITSFTGSAGTLFVTQDEAVLFVDSRYSIQAKEEMIGSNIKVADVSEISKFAKKHKKKVFAYYDKLVTVGEIERIAKYDCKWKMITKNPFEVLRNKRTVFTKPAQIFLSKENKNKLEYQNRILKKIKKLKIKKGESFVICSSDNVNWLLDIRGKDTQYTPLFVGFAVVENSKEGYKIHWIVNSRRVSNIPLPFYINLNSNLKSVLMHLKGTVKINKQETPCHVENILTSNTAIKLEYSENLCNKLKAVKSAREIKGIKEAHLQDAVAVINFLYWLELKKFNATEFTCEKRLDRFRLANANCTGLSFRTISASGKRAALCHYHAKNADHSLLNEMIYLVDSGGQYEAGTTDITRTISLRKKPSEELKKRFTQVLKGHIQLATAIFPSGTSGANLDSLARMYLWKDYLDFGHGTGHGVGCALNVHEGPQAISARNTFPLKAGMILSNEPGFYKEGEYGIRIENLHLVVKSGKERFLKFENLTLIPIDKKLMDMKLLSESKIQWINSYHKKVYERIVPFLKTRKKKLWLREITSPIQFRNAS